MIILGIDPGLASTGYGLIEVEKPLSKIQDFKVVDYGCFSTSTKDDRGQRLKKIYQAIKKLIKKHRPNLGVVEELFFAKNAKTAMKVGEARGVILMALAEQNIPLLELTPLQIKMALTGYGRASKKQIQKTVKLLLSLKKIPKIDDAADGLAAAICGVRLSHLK